MQLTRTAAHRHQNVTLEIGVAQCPMMRERNEMRMKPGALQTHEAILFTCLGAIQSPLGRVAQWRGFPVLKIGSLRQVQSKAEVTLL